MEWQATNTIGDCPKPVTIWSQAEIGYVVETPTGQQANEALSKETLQCPDLAAKGAMWHNPWQYKHGPNLAQWVNSISTSVGPFRGGWIDRGTQVWVPKVIPGTPRRCLYPSLSAKEEG